MAVRRKTPSRLIFLKELPLPGMIMFGRYRYAASQVGLRPHAHRNAVEICFLERGEQSYRVNGLVHRLRGHDQFFTLPGEIHDTANLPQERGVLYWIILNLAPGRGFLGLAPSLARGLQRELRRMPTRHFRAHPDCVKLLAEMAELLSRQRRRSKPYAAGELLRLQALLLRYLALTIEASHRGARGSASPLMQRVLDYVERHLADPISVPQLAQVARLSESRFKIRFKREIGVPPAEFWLRKKIGRAMELLKTKSVTEVAHELGFSSSQYFATAFKRYTLGSPSQARLT
jgi:AraC-like DNA-binding protein